MDDLLNWRAKLLDTTRPKHVDDIFTLLNTHNNPSGDQDKAVEFRRIAQSVERNIYAGATTKADYLQKLSWRKDSIMYRSGWKAQLRPDSRHSVVLKIMEILSTYVPPEDFEAEDGLRRFSGSFEEDAYSEATSLVDYLEKIAATLVHIGQNIRANSEQPNRGDSGQQQ